MTTVEFELNGTPVEVPAEGSLLDGLREQLSVRSAKDGCSPQGQCGCCTVWVDGQPRVSCVTPVARVRGRRVTTIEALPDAADWSARFAEHGATQCGFCTPGIIMRLAALTSEKAGDPTQVKKSLLAHMCRCTGWQPIVDAAVQVRRRDDGELWAAGREAAEERAELEGGVAQTVGPDVALGRGGFADDTAPDDALVALLDNDGEWVVGENLQQARTLSGKVQGRRTTAPLTWPIAVPEGDWNRTLQTTWVEPAYLEPDASWCEPGGEPMSSHGNGGAFGGKESGELGAVARRLADEHGRPVRVLCTREDVVRRGPKRPPLALGLHADGTGIVHVAATPGVSRLELPSGIELAEVAVTGPPTSVALRGAVLAEVLAALATLQPGPQYRVETPNGAVATAEVGAEGIKIAVSCGAVLDPVVLNSYCIGAVHMALGIVTSEGISIGDDGVPHDLTIRSFGVLRAVDIPPIDIEIIDTPAPAVNGSDAVFAAVLAAAWADRGFSSRWPTTAAAG